MRMKITSPEPVLDVFPDPVGVFLAPADRYFRHLLPLVSIDLSAVDPTWSGKIYIVNPVEPTDGMIGENTTSFHSPYTRTNWIGFKLNDKNQYELIGDFKFFQLEHEHRDPELDLQSRRFHEAYRLGARRFRQYGHLHLFFASRDNAPRPEREPILNQLGGSAPEGNWHVGSALQLDHSQTSDIVPLTTDGRRFRFVASATPWLYAQDDGTSEWMQFGADEILLFYDPIDRVALLTFEWG